ncbi:MAG: P-type DNA transfer ATPase VirB11 [Flavobacteriaceae bacterium]
MSNTKLLQRLLSHFNDLKNEKGVTEVMINRPNEIIIEKDGEMFIHKVKNFGFAEQLRLAKGISGQSKQFINDKNPLISCTLPQIDNQGGERVQIVIPPVSEPDKIIISMRVPSTKKITYEQYLKQGAFKRINQTIDTKEELREYYKAGDHYNFIKLAVRSKLNIMNSGGTSTGKTTFTNALVDLIPDDERIITLEDARELNLQNKTNKVHLITSKGGQGMSNITFMDLLEASLRLRPDRILQSEIRDSSAYYYLKGINTGHPGSISTVHADSAQNAITSINMLVMQANLGWSIIDIDRYVRSIIDVVIQWEKKDNQRYISEVLWLGENR